MSAGTDPQLFRLEATFEAPADTHHDNRATGRATWRRQHLLGSGAFGTVWKEECIGKEAQKLVRAVKQTPKQHRHAWKRELHAICKFTQNILVNRPGPDWHVKVADFGISKELIDGADSTKANVGTIGYIAPEVLLTKADRYTPSVDIWSLGAITYCLLTRKPPFLDIPDIVNYAKPGGSFPLQPLRRRRCSFDCEDSIQATMRADQNERLPIGQVLSHAWLVPLSEEDPSSEDDWEASNRWTTVLGMPEQHSGPVNMKSATGAVSVETSIRSDSSKQPESRHDTSRSIHNEDGGLLDKPFPGFPVLPRNDAQDEVANLLTGCMIDADGRRSSKSKAALPLQGYKIDPPRQLRQRLTITKAAMPEPKPAYSVVADKEEETQQIQMHGAPETLRQEEHTEYDDVSHRIPGLSSSIYHAQYSGGYSPDHDSFGRQSADRWRYPPDRLSYLQPPYSTASLSYPSHPVTEYICLFPNCNHTSARKADLEHHIRFMHSRDSAALVDCTMPGCHRVGQYGFTRKDKMVEHMREVHKVTEYICLFPNCNHTSARKADLDHHIKFMHSRDFAALVDCAMPGCHRVGQYGFTRKDKMVEHMREVHKVNIPKRSTAAETAARGSSREGRRV